MGRIYAEKFSLLLSFLRFLPINFQLPHLCPLVLWARKTAAIYSSFSYLPLSVTPKAPSDFRLNAMKGGNSASAFPFPDGDPSPGSACFLVAHQAFRQLLVWDFLWSLLLFSLGDVTPPFPDAESHRLSHYPLSSSWKAATLCESSQLVCLVSRLWTRSIYFEILIAILYDFRNQ